MRWHDRPQNLVLLQKAISKAVRAEKRDRVEKHLTRAEEAKGDEATRVIYRTINSLAPKRRGARETVWDAEERACFGQAEELDIRAQALKSIMAVEEQDEETASAMENTSTRQTQAISMHKFNEKQVYKLMMGLPDNKGGPKTRPGDGCWKGAPAELWKLVARQSSGLLAEFWTDVAQHWRHTTKLQRWRDRPPSQGGKNLRDAKNGWRTINLRDHPSKAYIQPYMPKIASQIHRCQFGALPCRGTREAILFVHEVTERFRSMANTKKSSQRSLRKMAVLLFDLEKAFDYIPRDRAFSESTKLAGSNGLGLIMEDLHRGTRYLLLGKDGFVRKKLSVSRGVRQGSVEGPVVFLALYTAIMDEVKNTRGSVGLQGVWACESNNEEEQEDEWQDISEVAFVDDMLSFLVYDTDDEVEEWASKVIECFEMFEMKAYVSNLEIMVVAWSTGSKPITRQVARGRLKFKVRGITIKAATSTKYLGTRIDVVSSSQKEVNARLQAASHAFTRWSRNIWKSGTLSERSKIKAFRTLVLPLLLGPNAYC